MIVTIFNAKGGVAKTTTTINLAAALSESGHAVACVNLDPQKNLLRFDQVLPPERLVNASGSFPDQNALADTLREHVERLAQSAEFVLIDCPPSPLECNGVALSLSDLAIAPVQPVIFGTDGLSTLQQTVAKVRRDANADLQWRVLITLVDARNPNHPGVVHSIRSQLGAVVLKNQVKSSIHFDGAALEGRSILDYSPRSHGAASYRLLADQVLELQPHATTTA